MYKIGTMGTFTTLPELAMAIYEGDTDRVEALLGQGGDVDAELELSKHTSLTPLDLALILGQRAVVELLVTRGAELNARDNPAMLKAVRYGNAELVRYLHAQGARLDGRNRVKSNAYDEAYYGNKKNLPLLHELGLDIKVHAGGVLRKAVAARDRKTVDYLLEQGVDINYHAADMIYPYEPTSLTVAARNNDLAMVRYLIERGADVTAQEKDGERAYTIAVSQRNEAMAAYLKALEPEDFHSLSNRLHALRSYKLPQPLLDYLSEGARRIELPANEPGVGYVELFQLTDTVEMKLGRTKLLRLSAELDVYSHLLLVWHPAKRRLGLADIEHREYIELAAADAFLADPGGMLARHLEEM